MSDDYWYKQAARAEKVEGDLRRQLDAAWDHINQLGQILRENNLDAGKLTGHIDEIAALSVASEIESRNGNDCRMSMISMVIDAEDAVDKGADPAVVCGRLFKSLHSLNEKWKSNGALAEARAIVAGRRERVVELLEQPGLFEAS